MLQDFKGKGCQFRAFQIFVKFWLCTEIDLGWSVILQSSWMRNVPKGLCSPSIRLGSVGVSPRCGLRILPGRRNFSAARRHSERPSIGTTGTLIHCWSAPKTSQPSGSSELNEDELGVVRHLHPGPKNHGWAFFLIKGYPLGLSHYL